MEKAQAQAQKMLQEKPEKPQKEQNAKQAHQPSKSAIWDCDSSLYDSFELQSFKRQLDSAIASRCMSMPREAVRLLPAASSRKPSKISRSFQKFLRSVFRSKPASDTLARKDDDDDDDHPEDGLYVVYQPSGGVAGDGKAGILPEFDPIVRRTRSERFADAAVVGIPCV